MMPRGFSSRTRSALRELRTIWQKTFCSRTRRAMSWPYCEPKSKIRTRSRSGSGVMAGRGLFVGELGEQFGERGLIVEVAVAAEAFDIHRAVIQEIHLPSFARHGHIH